MKNAILAAAAMLPAAAWAQTAPRPFTAGPPPTELPAQWMNALPPHQRASVTALHAACIEYSNAPSVEAQAAIVARMEGQVARLGPQPGRPWLGQVAERTVSGNSASLKIAIAPGVYVGTAATGMFSPDPYDTLLQRGGRLFQSVTDAARGTIVGFDAVMLRPSYTTGECSYRVRFRALQVMR